MQVISKKGLKFTQDNFLAKKQHRLGIHQHKPVHSPSSPLFASLVEKWNLSNVLHEQDSHFSRHFQQKMGREGVLYVYLKQIVSFQTKTSQELRMLSRSRLFIQKTKLIKNIYLPVDKDLLSTKQIKIIYLPVDKSFLSTNCIRNRC